MKNCDEKFGEIFLKRLSLLHFNLAAVGAKLRTGLETQDIFCMFITPLEHVFTSTARKIDASFGSSPWLVESRLISVIEETGFAIAQPFIEIALTIQHLALATIKGAWWIIKSDNEISRGAKIHARHAFHHLIGAIAVSPAFIFRHIIFSLSLLNPYHYHWARSNDNRILFNLINSWNVSQRLAAHLILKPSYSEEKVRALFTEVKNKREANGRVFQDGCLIETANSPEGEVLYRMTDGQHERTWLIKTREQVLEVTEYQELFDNFYPSRY